MDFPLIVVDPQAQIGGIAFAHAGRSLSKGDLVGIGDGDGGGAHHLPAAVERDGDVTGRACGGEQAGAAVDGAVSGVHRPAHVCGQRRGSAGLVRAHGGELNLGIGGVHLVCRAQRGVVKHAVRLHPGDDKDGGAHLPLLAVGGIVAGDHLAVALPAGDEGGGAAAVQQQGGHAAPGHHHLGHLKLGVAAGDGVALAVAHHGDHGAVCLQANGGVGHVAAALAHVDLTILHQKSAAGHCVLQLRQILLSGAVGDQRLAVLVDGKVVAAAGLVVGDAVNDQNAAGLAGGHVVVVGIQRRHDGGVGVLAGAPEIALGGLRLIGYRLHPPADGFVREDGLHPGVSGHDLRLTQIDLTEVVHVLIQTGGLVGVGHILRDTRGQGIGRL